MADDTEQNNVKLRARGEALLAEARARAAELQRALAAAVGDTSARAGLDAAEAALSGAASELALALNSPGFALTGTDLAGFARIVHSPATVALVADATAKGNSTAERAHELAAASAATHATTARLADDLFRKRIFAPYLHFESQDEERAYRQREAERREYIAAQLAQGTPEGTLNAAGAAAGQMLDAHTHGAGDSPEWQPRWNKLSSDIRHQQDAMRRAGHSTAEFDRNLRQDVHRFLKARGLSEAEIEARFAVAAQPLDAVKPPLSLAEMVLRDKAINQDDTPLPPTLGLDAITARLQAAGVLETQGEGHGVNSHQAAQEQGTRTPG